MTTLQSREDALLRRVRAFDWARLKWCFAATALCMLLAHGFAWFNLFPSHDGTILVFDADVVMLQLGRWVAAAVLSLSARQNQHAPGLPVCSTCCGCRFRCT